MVEVSSDNNFYEWTVFPMRENPARGILFWVIVIVTIWAVYWNVGSLFLTFVAAFMLLGSLTSFFLRTTYRIDENGAGFRRFIFKKLVGWSRIRSVNDEQSGIFLSPFPVKSKLENFRGIFLPYRNNRDNVIEIMRKYVPDVEGLPELVEDHKMDDEDRSTNQDGLNH